LPGDAFKSKQVVGTVTAYDGAFGLVMVVGICFFMVGSNNTFL
jgi:hypothetical protein